MSATPQRYKLPSHNRLKLRKDIETLFLTGKAFSVFPFRVVYKMVDSTNEKATTKFGISVPKKKISKAVNRNLIKRRVREAWRLQQHLIVQNTTSSEQSLHCFLIYIGTANIPEYAVIAEAVSEIIAKLQQIFHS